MAQKKVLSRLNEGEGMNVSFDSQVNGTFGGSFVSGK